MSIDAIQESYSEIFSGCFGCGRHNSHGLQIKSFWEGEEAVCTWQPESHHRAAPGVLNGGIIASIIDCHSIGLAIADAYRREGRPLGSAPEIIYVTGSLTVTYLRPTPLAGPVTLRARVAEAGERKSRIACTLFADGQPCAESEVLAVRVRAPAPD